jgi:predicted permease
VVPVSGDRWNDVIVVEGYTPKDPDDAQIWFNRVSPRYFSTLGTRLAAGRDFDAGDVPTAPRVAIVNDAFARRFFQMTNVVGRQFRTRMRDTLSAPFTIVGLVENAKYESLREDPGPIAYLAASQGEPGTEMTAELRIGCPQPVRGRTTHECDPATLAPAVRLAVRRVNPRIILELETLSNQLASSLSRERLLAALSALFGAIALLLATLGLYGVMAYSVARRTNEIGVRRALGADRGRIISLVLGEVGRVVLAGTLVGVTAAAWIGKLMSSFLFGTQPIEPLVLASAAALLGVVAAAAGFVPALRASRVDPMVALRE